jgi:hypothetical protein
MEVRMPALITVQLDAVAALADELSLLAVRLAEEPPRCRTAGAALETALGDPVGEAAAGAATAWGAVAQLLADECATTARTLRAAVAGYRAEDAGLAVDLTLRRVGTAARPR